MQWLRSVWLDVRGRRHGHDGAMARSTRFHRRGSMIVRICDLRRDTPTRWNLRMQRMW